MSLNLLIRLFGLLDLVLFFSNVIADISASKIPLYDNFKNLLAHDQAFGGHFIYIVTILGFVAILSSICSGVLMLLLKKSGVYISFVQAPLRLLLIMPPTFFFLAKLKAFIPIPVLIFTALILLLEIVKIIFQVIWLRNKKSLR